MTPNSAPRNENSIAWNKSENSAWMHEPHDEPEHRASTLNYEREDGKISNEVKWRFGVYENTLIASFKKGGKEKKTRAYFFRVNSGSRKFLWSYRTDWVSVSHFKSQLQLVVKLFHAANSSIKWEVSDYSTTTCKLLNQEWTEEMKRETGFKNRLKMGRQGKSTISLSMVQGLNAPQRSQNYEYIKAWEWR